ncbi:MAG: hypothetical protein O3A14_08335 [Cyanobacteria bacterium]|nr:hypothetical protein [Cyanobacteriota bacterium]
MTTATPLPQAPDLSTDSYLVVGIATCYIRTDGETREVTILEPVPSAYLESVLNQVPTSYQQIQSVTLGQVVSDGNPQRLLGLSADVQLGENFVDRAIAAARTYQARPATAALLPVGSTYTELNYSTQKKRVLNLSNVVTADDNVKQHAHTHKVL